MLVHGTAAPVHGTASPVLDSPGYDTAPAPPSRL